MKQLEAESTWIHQVCFVPAVSLKALLGQWNTSSVTGFRGEGDCLLDIIDAEKRCHTTDTFREYYGPIANKWSRSVRRSIMHGLHYTRRFVLVARADHQPERGNGIASNVPHLQHFFALVAPQHDMSQLEAEFLEYQAYDLQEIMGPLHF